MHVHISNLAAQTGASLFLQSNAPPFPDYLRIPTVNSSNVHTFPSPPWIYDKTEHLTIPTLTSTKSITHIITEERPDEEVERHWEVVAGVAAFDKWVVDWRMLQQLFGRDNNEKVETKPTVEERVLGVLKMVKKEKLWVLQRKS
ncbi:hypothetical protein C0993_004332 [Termitomyces sp. T159_Od127]|nr:hypothetical protein C0993_004332 [Termitomyces sp. T159_Od127]